MDVSADAAEALAWTLTQQIDPDPGRTLLALACAVLCAVGIYLGRRWGGP